MRIAIAGFQHETNTFAPGRVGLDDFKMTDSWPGLLQGAAVVSETRGLNLPIAGAVAADEQIGGIELVPILWCAAEPSGAVTDAAFDWISGRIINGLEDAGPLDAICLDLHGAMVTESQDDGEGTLLTRVRQAVGPDIAIGVSLDMHANISARIVDAATLLTVYRTYPHLDMAATGARCMRELARTLSGTTRMAAFRQAPFLVPLHAQHTGADPCRTLYRLLDELPESAAEYVELGMGFTAANVHDCGPSVVAYAETRNRAEILADAVLKHLCGKERSFDTSLLSGTDAARTIIAVGSSRPIILADAQDNPGAGGTSDTTGLLHALIDCAVPQALSGVICDSTIAAQAHQAGVGSVFAGSLGARSDPTGSPPVPGRFRVMALSNGSIAYTGEMHGGGVASIGPSCLLSLEGIAGDITVVVSSLRTQCLDQALFTYFGADPARWSIVCVKSTVYFPADFEPISAAILYVAEPGGFLCQLDEVPYRKLRTGLRLGPGGPTFSGCQNRLEI